MWSGEREALAERLVQPAVFRMLYLGRDQDLTIRDLDFEREKPSRDQLDDLWSLSSQGLLQSGHGASTAYRAAFFQMWGWWLETQDTRHSISGDEPVSRLFGQATSLVAQAHHQTLLHERDLTLILTLIEGSSSDTTS